jgi:hypothetical protein
VVAANYRPQVALQAFVQMTGRNGDLFGDRGLALALLDHFAGGRLDLAWKQGQRHRRGSERHSASVDAQ